MQLNFQPADEAAIRAFLVWRYDPPYDIYNEDPGQADELVRYFRDPQIACHAITDPAGSLVAYCTFGLDGRVPGGDYTADALDIGFSLRPDLTGQGRGHLYVDAVLAFARRTFAPPAFRVTVAEFNLRAQRVWEKAGFRPVQRFPRDPDGLSFLILVRRSDDRA